MRSALKHRRGHPSRIRLPSPPFRLRVVIKMKTAVWPLYQIASTAPCPAHPLFKATPTDGCTLQFGASRLKLLPRRRTPLYFGNQGALCRPIEDRYADIWIAGFLDHRQGRPLLSHPRHLHSTIRVLVEMKTRSLRPLSFSQHRVYDQRGYRSSPALP